MTSYAIIAALSIAGATLPVAALAQTPAPAPTATPLRVFSARATVAAEAQVFGNPFKLDAEIAAMKGVHSVRIDLLHLTMSGSDPSMNAMIAQFLPQGKMTMAYDETSRTTTIWSDARRVYYQTKRVVISRARTTTAGSRPTRGSPLDQLLRATDAMTKYTSLNESFTLVGHQIINGHPASLFHLSSQMQKQGGQMQALSGDLALADDVSGIPVRFWMTATGEHTATFKFDMLELSPTAPDASAFVVPSGYKRVRDLSQVLGSGTPH